MADMSAENFDVLRSVLARDNRKLNAAMDQHQGATLLLEQMGALVRNNTKILNELSLIQSELDIDPLSVKAATHSKYAKILKYVLRNHPDVAKKLVTSASEIAVSLPDSGSAVPSASALADSKGSTPYSPTAAKPSSTQPYTPGKDSPQAQPALSSSVVQSTAQPAKDSAPPGDAAPSHAPSARSSPTVNPMSGVPEPEAPQQGMPGARLLQLASDWMGYGRRAAECAATAARGLSAQTGECEVLRQEYSLLQAQLQQAYSDNSKGYNSVHSLRQTVDALGQANTDLEEQIANYKAAVQEALEDNERLEARAADVEQRTLEVEARLARTDEAFRHANAERDTLVQVLSQMSSAKGLSAIYKNVSNMELLVSDRYASMTQGVAEALSEKLASAVAQYEQMLARIRHERPRASADMRVAAGGSHSDDPQSASMGAYASILSRDGASFTGARGDLHTRDLQTGSFSGRAKQDTSSDAVMAEVVRTITNFGPRAPALQRIGKRDWVVERNGRVLTIGLNAAGKPVVESENGVLLVQYLRRLADTSTRGTPGRRASSGAKAGRKFGDPSASERKTPKDLVSLSLMGSRKNA